MLDHIYTQFTLHVVHPLVVGIGRNAPVHQLPSDAHMRTCDTVAKCPIPTEVLKCLIFWPLNSVP